MSEATDTFGKVLAEYSVLDHGHVWILETMGDDSTILSSARQSTQSKSTDDRLIDYLYRNKHTSPFEMCEIRLHAKMPIFVARQWVRHRTANINEQSARYSVLPNEYYVPSIDVIAAQSTRNKQGREDTPFERQVARDIQATIIDASDSAYSTYETLLDLGLARELARMILPVNFYTQWVWKTDLHNLLHFLRLRRHEHAQYEMREYANVIARYVAQWVPRSWQAFERTL